MTRQKNERGDKKRGIKCEPWDSRQERTSDIPDLNSGCREVEEEHAYAWPMRSLNRLLESSTATLKFMHKQLHFEIRKDSLSAAPCEIWLKCCFECKALTLWNSELMKEKCGRFFHWTCGMVSDDLLFFMWWPMKFNKTLEHVTFFFMSCNPQNYHAVYYHLWVNCSHFSTNLAGWL